LAGNLLYENGYIKREYIESMLKRENQASTYLANGIAIPHGCIEDKDYINETGIVVLQFKNGIKWDDENIVYIVVGIAAKDEEHIGVLANLTKVVQNKDVAELLRKTNDVNVVIDKLSEVTKTEDRGITINVNDFPICLDITVKEAHGLHARPATSLIEQLKEFNGDVYIEHKGKFADARNLIAI